MSGVRGSWADSRQRQPVHVRTGIGSLAGVVDSAVVAEGDAMTGEGAEPDGEVEVEVEVELKSEEDAVAVQSTHTAHLRSAVSVLFGRYLLHNLVPQYTGATSENSAFTASYRSFTSGSRNPT